MARRTRLFQAAGSPLIQGQSRMERPAWQPALGGAGVAMVLWVAWSWVGSLDGGNFVRSAVSQRGFAFLVGVLAGALAGSYVARAWGSHHRWLPAALTGLVVGTLAAAAVSAG